MKTIVKLMDGEHVVTKLETDMHFTAGRYEKGSFYSVVVEREFTVEDLPNPVVWDMRPDTLPLAVSPQVAVEIAAVIWRGGGKGRTLKFIRGISGFGLKDAKQFVEQVVAPLV